MSKNKKTYSCLWTSVYTDGHRSTGELTGNTLKQLDSYVKLYTAILPVDPEVTILVFSKVKVTTSNVKFLKVKIPLFIKP